MTSLVTRALNALTQFTLNVDYVFREIILYAPQLKQ